MPAQPNAMETNHKSVPIHALRVRGPFSGLTDREKLYAHYLAKAAWSGTRIILRQVSPESNTIFDFILELSQACRKLFAGDWYELAKACGVTEADIKAFLDYGATFLSNIGNYYGSGDQKFRPRLKLESMRAVSHVSEDAQRLFDRVAHAMYSPQPSSLGFPGHETQSAYYPSDVALTKEEVADVTVCMEQRGVLPENTRIRKTMQGGEAIYEVLQASTLIDPDVQTLKLRNSGRTVRVVKGDHAHELTAVCQNLREASKFAANEKQEKFLEQYIASFESGDLEVYKESQKSWIKDTAPRVENVFGFVEPYRDPFGIRAEFEGLVAISDAGETKLLSRLVEESSKFIKQLPWAQGFSDNNGKGPFEKSLFEPPDFSSIHALAYCSSIIFGGINLPNYNDIRQDCGFKNVIIANRMTAESNTSAICPFIDPSEASTFQKHKYPAYYVWVVLHELLGHGTGKMMCEGAHGTLNFDIEHPPINPLTGEPISLWYRPGQTWTGVFADLATTVDECRAELVGAFLMDNKELLSLFGFDSSSGISAEDITYNVYLQLGVDGLGGLQNYNVEADSWGQAHSRAHFAMLKCLLRDGKGFMQIDCNSSGDELQVRVDRSRIFSDGKPALAGMLLELHMYRCTADVQSCRSYYEELSKVDGEYLEWRRIVLVKMPPKWVFVQPNTSLDGNEVILKEYEPTPEGVIQSWTERGL
ncbi:MAG: hypothetical protein Q9178_007356 [Gyalolechia marmorata]